MVIFHGYVSHNQMVFYTIQSTGDDHNPGESTEVLRVLQLRRFFWDKAGFSAKNGDSYSGSTQIWVDQMETGTRRLSDLSGAWGNSQLKTYLLYPKFVPKHEI